MEIGLSKGFRKQLFSEIERTTAMFARAVEETNPGRLPVSALHRAVENLETVGLLELNFNQASALERFSSAHYESGQRAKIRYRDSQYT